MWNRFMDPVLPVKDGVTGAQCACPESRLQGMPGMLIAGQRRIVGLRHLAPDPVCGGAADAGKVVIELSGRLVSQGLSM